MAHKSPKWAVIMNSKTNSMQNKPINERKGREMFVDVDVKKQAELQFSRILKVHPVSWAHSKLKIVLLLNTVFVTLWQLPQKRVIL